jgi:hypothetical protein
MPGEAGKTVRVYAEDEELKRHQAGLTSV